MLLKRNDAVDSFVIEVEGVPRPWVRPQTAGGRARKQKNKAGQWVDPPAVAHLETLTEHVFAAVRQLGPRWISNTPVHVEVKFVFGLKKKRAEARTIIRVTRLPQLPGSVDQWRTKVPDCDNLAKLVAEALQHGGAIDDDSQISKLTAEKIDVGR